MNVGFVCLIEKMSSVDAGYFVKAIQKSCFDHML